MPTAHYVNAIRKEDKILCGSRVRDQPSLGSPQFFILILTLDDLNRSYSLPKI
jgi:hypothetical protein